MRKGWKITFILTVLIIFLCNIYGIIIIVKKSRSADLGPTALFYRGETVTVSGEVRFRGYKQGTILIMAKSKPSKLLLVPDINMLEIPRPGKYSITIPKNRGKVYIEAVNMKRSDMGGAQAGLFQDPFGSYPGNPLRVGSEDMREVNIEIIETPIPLIMTYKGPTVTVSGNISFKEYKKGRIVVMASQEGSQPGRRTDISFTELSSPGKFSLKVPRDIGKIYVEAVTLKEDFAEGTPRKEIGDAPFGSYPGNPLRVGSEDIKNIDIEIALVSNQN